MKFLTYILVITSFFFHSYAFCENHNNIEVDLERVKKDIIDLQKFVYKNGNEIPNQTNEILDLDNVNQLIKEIKEQLDSIEIQMKDMKDDISNLYLLYTSPEYGTTDRISPSEELNIDESSSNIFSEKSDDNQILGQMTLGSLDENNQNENENENIIIDDKTVDNESEQSLGELTISSLEDEVIVIPEPSDEDLSTLSDIDQLMKKKEIELNTPKIDPIDIIQMAKQNLASSENQKAIENLLLIVESKTNNLEILAEAYYLLGRTYFIEGQMMDSIKYFGIRHRDLSEITKFRSDSYFWLGKSLFNIGDQENGCLIMEDIIFSDLYLDKAIVVEEAKSLQKEKNCGLIID